MIYFLDKLGFHESGRATFDQIMTLINECCALLSEKRYEYGDELLTIIQEIKFKHHKKGETFLDYDTGEEYIIPCEAISIAYNHDAASAFDKFTNNNPITKVGFMEINTLGNVLGCAVGHYRIREWGGGHLFFVVE